MTALQSSFLKFPSSQLHFWVEIQAGWSIHSTLSASRILIQTRHLLLEELFLNEADVAFFPIKLRLNATSFFFFPMK
jgi:hypothetical protein